MPFVKLSPRLRNFPSANKPAVLMSINDEGSRLSRLVRVIIRPHLLAPPVPWLTPGVRVNVEVGEGPDEGYLRVSPGQDFKLNFAGVKKNSPGRPLMAVLPAVPGAQPGAQMPTACEYSSLGGALLIEMPDWAYTPTKKPVPQPTTLPAAPEMRGAPFKLGAPSHAEVIHKSGARGK